MSKPDHQSELDEVFRKIGRNVFHFQRLEALLKFLIARSTLNGNAENFLANQNKSADSVSRKTMGNLVKDLFQQSFTKTERKYRNRKRSKRERSKRERSKFLSRLGWMQTTWKSAKQRWQELWKKETNLSTKCFPSLILRPEKTASSSA